MNVISHLPAKSAVAFNDRGITGQAADLGGKDLSCRLFSQIPIAGHRKSTNFTVEPVKSYSEVKELALQL